jgi:glycolate oxidase
MLLCTCVSLFGLTNLVVKGYGTLGYVGLFFVVIPELTIGMMKIRKNAALRKQQGLTEGVDTIALERTTSVNSERFLDDCSSRANFSSNYRGIAYECSIMLTAGDGRGKQAGMGACYLKETDYYMGGTLMSKYNLMNPELLEALKDVLGERFVSVDPEKLDKYKTDEEANPEYHHMPEAVVFPENTAQVAAVVRLANQYNIPVTPRGAGTGLAGGAIPVYGGIVLVLDRMDKILEFNEDSLYVVAQAGARTAVIQKEAKNRGLLYAGDPCSSDSCLIGGNVATNAGGNRAVKYGTTRDQVYAIEVVTPEGDIVNLGSRLPKKTTGFALEQLLIGAEGTLGIITAVTLKLKPLPPHKMDMVAVFDNVDKALSLPNKVVKAGLNPTSMEFMANDAIRSTGRFIKVDLPYANSGGVWIIITIEEFSEDELGKKIEKLDEICTSQGALEILIADEDRIWKARRNVAEASRADSLIYYPEDIVVPTDKIADIMKKLPELENKYEITTQTAAHIGDGNIHVNVLKGDLSDEIWNSKLDEFHDELYAYVYELGGRLSGEHGIGSKKIKEMEKFTDPMELKMMRAIKQALDPKGILNPGKIFTMTGYQAKCDNSSM